MRALHFNLIRCGIIETITWNAGLGDFQNDSMAGVVLEVIPTILLRFLVCALGNVHSMPLL